MKYQHIRRGRFIARPNRFVAQIELDGQTEICHVKNTGRCRELLLPGAAVYLERAASPARKTGWDLVAVEKGARLINMDAQDRSGPLFVEVKGVTLEEDGQALFPDAPTERGVKHLRGLARAVEQGYRAAVFFVIQMEGIRCFRPNDRTHPAFGEALREAAERGVGVYAYDCLVTPDSLTIRHPVEVVL